MLKSIHVKPLSRATFSEIAASALQLKGGQRRQTQFCWWLPHSSMSI